MVVREVGGDVLKKTFVTRSPIHFEYGDMRRAYGWTGAMLTAGAMVGALVITLRVLLTGLFVAFITTDILPVIVFNVCMTVVVGRWLLGEVRIRPPKHRLERRTRNYRSSSLSCERRATNQSSKIDRL
jgi:hypothetical protein